MSRAKFGVTGGGRAGRDVRSRVDQRAAEIDQHRGGAPRCTVTNCELAADGLRMAQEIDLLRNEIAALRKENVALKDQLEVARARQAGPALRWGAED